MDEATELARQFTNGQGADATIIAVGVNDPAYVMQGMASIRKGGTCVVTAVTPASDLTVPMSLLDLTMSQKRLQGTLFGASNATWDIADLLQLYRDGVLHLDEMATKTYPLDEIEQGYRDMHDGKKHPRRDHFLVSGAHVSGHVLPVRLSLG
jgi:Zn-dependent alcohol dehydrogenase